MKENQLSFVLTDRLVLLTFVLTGFLSFALPFSLGGPQLLVGTIVNASLFLAASLLPGYFIKPIIFLPGLAVLSRGLIFGPLTYFLVLLLPFIWLANWILVTGFKKVFNKQLFKNQSLNYVTAVFSAAVLKSLFLFAIAWLLVSFGLLPKLFLTTMGAIQLLTAVLGGSLSLAVNKAFYYHRPSNDKHS